MQDRNYNHTPQLPTGSDQQSPSRRTGRLAQLNAGLCATAVSGSRVIDWTKSTGAEETESAPC